MRRLTATPKRCSVRRAGSPAGGDCRYQCRLRQSHKEPYGFERAEESWRRSSMLTTSMPSASWWPTICIARSPRRSWHPASTCYAKSRSHRRVQDAEAMAKAAAESGRVAACGFSYRRSPAASAIGEQITNGSLGEILHFNGRYWCDYSADPAAPTSWRYQGPLGSGALADIGSHILDLSEYLCGRSPG